jgi:hypothetical protein
MFFSSVRKSVEGDAKKSVLQIRGVSHPQACAFVAEATTLLAVAGWDADGNGYFLLLSEFATGEEPRRVGYHVLYMSAVQDETDDDVCGDGRLTYLRPPKEDACTLENA